VRFHFENHVLDVGRRELRRGSQLVALEPQVFDLLLYLLQNRDRVVSKSDLIAAVWGGRIVSDSTLDSRINAARKAVGDSGTAQRLIRTSARKGLRFVAAVREAEDQIEDAPLVPGMTEKQEISFCRSGDGVNIAFAGVGSGTPLLKAANWLTHLEYDWESPLWLPLLRWLAARTRLIRYDSRGNGLSDQDVKEISFDGFVRDFECVVKATKFDRFAILGISQGAAIAINYAALHPERVSKLILLGGYAQGRNMRDSEAEKEKARVFLSLMQQGWGDEHSAFMRAFASIFIPNGSPEQIKWFADLQRITTSAQNAVRIRNACDAIDIVSLLPKVSVPTLVLHCRHDNVVPLEQGRLMATSIPNARFVTLESENHVLIPGEPAWPKFLDEIEAFLAE
jgi:DNA-binding winged helix-turn-helix (wHTH) protein/alpha-beta hydrolase superfamily lysophospholipase